MKLFHPKDRHLTARNRLLQRALRPEPAPFAIEREYPLVLSAGNTSFSYCIGEGDDVIAHANLWPRVLVEKGRGRETKVGLVGNVATDERFRGRGVMRALLDELRQEAYRQELRALVLWSDLLGFYQKVGFQSFGHERRWRCRAATLARAGVSPGPFARVTTKAAPALAEGMLAARFPVAGTLARSVEEFQKLLAIPAVDVFIAKGPSGAVEGYALLGKGCDMVGVVHEWGARTPEALLMAASAAAGTGFDEIVVLAPPLPDDWSVVLRRHADGDEPHALGLAWMADDAAVREALAASFIWGLDSI